MNRKIRYQLRRAKRSLARRLDPQMGSRRGRKPMLGRGSLKYEFSGRVRAISHGGLGAMHQVALKSGLVDAIDEHLHVLSEHRPYHESDHVLLQAYNIACGGTALDHIETLRSSEVVLDALGAERLPAPTTAGDFCRRFEPKNLKDLQAGINEARLHVWGHQEESFFQTARLDVDGSVVETSGECKEGIGRSFKGLWGYYPQLVTLANTRELLSLVNQSGNDNSTQAVGDDLDEAALYCRRAGFRDVLMRGDTAFSFTSRLDGWHERGDRFIFGYQARENLVGKARDKADAEYERLVRRAKAEPQHPRRKQPRVKRRIIQQKGYKDLVLESEHLSEFDYRPTACERDYRIVVLRKEIRIERHGVEVARETRYLFYITNDRELSQKEVVFEANQRCDQENIIEQLKATRALHAPVNTLLANAAYMLMASLAWTLKSWMALLLPVSPRWRERHTAQRRRWLRMDFATFRRAVLAIPAQIIRHARRLTYRFLAYKPQLPVLFRLLDGL